MWLLLLACVSPGDTPAREVPTTPPAQDPRALRALSLPDETPFVAWSRVTPMTLVDARGQPVHVITEVGVELTVKTLLPDRAEVRCTGCRVPIDAWAQRAALFVGTTPADGPHDALLSWLNDQENPELQALRRSGLVQRDDGALFAPPWRDEGGYQGGSVVVTPRGDDWSATVETAPADRSPAAPALEEG